jgi:hypothetical protein
MSADVEVPDDVQAFMQDYVDSYEELEVLLLAHRTCDQWRSAAAIAEQLPLPGISAETAEVLVTRGLLSVQTTEIGPIYTFAPADPVLEAAVTRLAQWYTSAPLAVMKLMMTHAMNRLRVRALQRFAEAFVLRRKQKRDG